MATRTTKRAMRAVPTYSDGETTVQFFALANTPGYSHRVIINGVPRDWLGSHCRPSVMAARFFADKHAVRAAATA